MNGYLDHLVDRTLGLVPTLEPRRRSRFEAAAPPPPELDEITTGWTAPSVVPATVALPGTTPTPRSRYRDIAWPPPHHTGPSHAVEPEHPARRNQVAVVDQPAVRQPTAERTRTDADAADADAAIADAAVADAAVADAAVGGSAVAGSAVAHDTGPGTVAEQRPLADPAGRVVGLARHRRRGPRAPADAKTRPAPSPVSVSTTGVESHVDQPVNRTIATTVSGPEIPEPASRMAAVGAPAATSAPNVLRQANRPEPDIVDPGPLLVTASPTPQASTGRGAARTLRRSTAPTSGTADPAPNLAGPVPTIAGAAPVVDGPAPAAPTPGASRSVGLAMPGAVARSTSAAPVPPKVTVTIGRVEVRPPPVPPPIPEPLTGPQPLSLDEYLERRAGGPP